MERDSLSCLSIHRGSLKPLLYLSCQRGTFKPLLYLSSWCGTLKPLLNLSAQRGTLKLLLYLSSQRWTDKLLFQPISHQWTLKSLCLWHHGSQLETQQLLLYPRIQSRTRKPCYIPSVNAERRTCHIQARKFRTRESLLYSRKKNEEKVKPCYISAANAEGLNLRKIGMISCPPTRKVWTRVVSLQPNAERF